MYVCMYVAIFVRDAIDKDSITRNVWGKEEKKGNGDNMGWLDASQFNRKKMNK